MTVCRICGSDGEHRLYKVREMQFGTRDEFVYFDCTNCKCLQLRDIPENLSDYYPDSYYSFHSIPSTENPSLYQRARKHGLRKIVDYQSTNKSTLGRLLEKRYGHGFIPYWLLKSGLNISHDSKILDVGCGSGETLIQLERAGFTNLLGVDPFIPSDIAYPNGIKVLKSSLESLNDSFDFIMLHHSFEHMKDQLRVLQTLNSLLPARHYLLIRIPIRSHAWEHYGTNWVQIDAPRHLFLHSTESIELLASQAGFEVSEIIYDSDEFQFWGSEQYAKDIPLMAEDSYQVDPSKSIFSQAEIESYAVKANLLNQEKRGDQACIYLQKTV
jgi:SAM-dependent methyltransferase